MKQIEIHGRVLRGEQYGRRLGFPTANLDRRYFVRKKINIGLGVYAGKASCQPASPSQGGLSAKSYKLYKAAIVIGPIDKTGRPKIEAHLIGFKGSLYGKSLNIYLNTYLRKFKKFNSESELKKQISLDVEKVRKSVK